MGWIKIVGKMLEYSGKLAQAEGFSHWADSVVQDRIESWATDRGIRFFKNRRGRNAWWKELKIAAEKGSLRAAIEQEIKEYQRLPGSIASSIKELPRSGSGIYPIVVVPRFLCNVVALDRAIRRIGESDELQRLSGGKVLAQYFLEELIRQTDAALVSTRPSLRSPAPTTARRFIIDLESEYAWANETPGHYYVAESFHDQWEKHDRQRHGAPLEDLKVTLGRLSLRDKQLVIRDLVAALTK